MTESNEEDLFAKEQLHFAAMNGDLQEVQGLVRAGHSVNMFDELGKTPLHYAVEYGHLDIASFLLEAGADINAHDESKAGNTPLGDVARDCKLATAEFLLKHGADPRIPGIMQITAIKTAEARKDKEGRKVVRAMWDAIKRNEERG